MDGMISLLIFIWIFSLFPQNGHIMHCISLFLNESDIVEGHIK